MRIYEAEYSDNDDGAALDAVCLMLGGGILDHKIVEAIAAAEAALQELLRLQQLEALRFRH